MPSDPSYKWLLSISQETFAEGDYETACHTLMAALERARYLQDTAAITAIGQITAEQLAALNHMALPARFAGERGVRQQSLLRLYSSILQQSSTWRDLVDHWQQHKERSTPKAPAPGEEANQEPPPAETQS